MTPERAQQLYREFTGDSVLLDVAPHQAHMQFQDLIDRYSQGRYYHTIEHVSWGLLRIAEIHHHDNMLHPAHARLVRMAMWFHDAVMNFNEWSFLDERSSAYLARTYLGSSDQGRVVSALIRSTAHLEPPEGPMQQVLWDADLSILGSDDNSFREYELNVRREWDHVDEDSFWCARAAVLRRFVEMDHIFHTPYGRKKWEERARTNLKESLRKISLMPGCEGKLL